MKKFENIYSDMYFIEEKEKQIKEMKKQIILITLFFVFLFIVIFAFFLINRKKDNFEVDEKYFKTGIKKIDNDFKKYISLEKRRLKKQKEYTDEEKIYLELEKKYSKENKETATEKEEKEKANENQEQKDENKVLKKKGLFVRPETFEIGKVTYLKYNVLSYDGNLYKEDIKIYPLKKGKQIIEKNQKHKNENKKNENSHFVYSALNSPEDVLIYDENNKEQIYNILQKSFDNYIKDEKNKKKLEYIYPDEKKRTDFLKDISEKIKTKKLLDTASHYIDDEGLHVYLDDRIIYTEYTKDNLLKYVNSKTDVIDCESCLFNKIDFKLNIFNEDIYGFLKDEFKNDYLKAIQSYKAKIERLKLEEAERKAKEKEEAKKARKELLKDKKYIALSFDDGPDQYTEYFLDKLREKNVKTSFFILGHKVPGREHILKKMLEDGHDIGNHSYDHSDFSYLKKEDVLKNIALADEQIKGATGGFVTKYLRPPYGARNWPAEIESGKTTILWNFDPLDWKYRDVERIKQQIMLMPENAVAVMHDIHKTTVDAVLEIIDEKREQGFEFVTITELLEKTGGKI